MHKPRIIFFDIDGTLIDMEKKRITERTLDALRRLQQNGILLAIATGRSPLIVPRFDGVEFDVFLTYNGSYCYDRRGDIFVSPIPPQDVQTLIQNAAALGRPVSVAGRTQLLSNGTDDDLTAYYAIGGRAPVISDKFDEVSRGEVFQLLMGCRESDWPAILKGTSGAKIAAWWDRAVDIIPISGGKGAGIQLKVPNSPFRLLRNGPRKIEEGTIFKVRLFPVLHFYDNTFTGIGYAIDVVDKTSFCFYFRLLFTVKELNVGNHMLSYEQIVQEVD